ncbi:transcriptional regulator, RpiR family [Burkholderia sp. lig30]|jgi:DNA-binding MurR/RpiR family transcriptional regulator|uniref:MurR/RpiR family transcriptional regulator n=1 Tax=Burkholderia sp. lig30 TaxID=1192124 RepID=UPI0004619195|nr:MurR/RpiR family transcriptional regulator [Burkholderia sp. lig30]KDB08969.1 transcriptional regulator, RpiR family [Burkholderia sp. lig30]
MEASIRALLLSQMDSFTPGEQKVAQALLDRYPSLGLGPISGVAKQANVSDPTVFRFVVRLGFPSYASFQQALHNEIDEAMNSPLDRMRTFHSTPAQNESPMTVFQRLSQSLNTMILGLDIKAFNEAASLLVELDARIFCGGGRYTSPLASMFSYALGYMRPNVRCIEPDLKIASIALADMGPGDILVIFDFRRYQEDSVRFAEAASKLGVRILLITDEWISPIGEFADVILSIKGRPFAMLETKVPALALCEAILISVTNRLPDSSKKRMEIIEALSAGELH